MSNLAIQKYLLKWCYSPFVKESRHVKPNSVLFIAMFKFRQVYWDKKGISWTQQLASTYNDKPPGPARQAFVFPRPESVSVRRIAVQGALSCSRQRVAKPADIHGKYDGCLQVMCSCNSAICAILFSGIFPGNKYNSGKPSHALWALELGCGIHMNQGRKSYRNGKNRTHQILWTVKSYRNGKNRTH